MTRWVGGLTVAVIGLLTVLAWYSHGAVTAPLPVVAAPPVQPAAAPPAEAESVRVESVRVESVRVEHELVEARLFVPLARPRVVLAAASRRAEARRDPPRFAVRASRALVGDGRYVPQPFPRPATR